MLVVSGHHGEGNVFFSDALEKNEFLPIEELERVSCSDSCPSLFANLKEVYLFGCNTLNAEAQHGISGEVARSFVREGKPPQEAARLARLLGQERGESSRDRMRLLFKDVPVIYGFSAVAPLGSVAGPVLNRYFQSSGIGEVGKGRASSGMLRQFSSHGMVATRGIGAGDPLVPLRQDVCNFADDRMSVAQKLDSVHRLLQRPAAESRLLLDRIERFTATLADGQQHPTELAQARERIERDTDTRERYLAFARDADQFQTRARMVDVAHDLGWLSPAQRRDELVTMLGQMLARKDIGGPDVDLACKLNKDGGLDGTLDRLVSQAARVDDVAPSAVHACLGSAEARERVLEGLVSPADADVRIAQAYLRHRPIAEGELRVVTRAIARMSAPDAQARALDVLARHYLSDSESIATLKQLFANTRSWPVQNAVAGVLILPSGSRSRPRHARSLPNVRA